MNSLEKLRCKNISQWYCLVFHLFCLNITDKISRKLHIWDNEYLRVFQYKALKRAGQCIIGPLNLTSFILVWRSALSVIPYWKKKGRHKISLIKNFITGKTCHFLATNFLAWLSENIIWIKKTWTSSFNHSFFLLIFKSFNRIQSRIYKLRVLLS